MSLDNLHTLDDVATALGMSERWVRGEIKATNADITKLGHKIRFTDDQFEAFVANYRTAPAVAQSITTGKKRRSA